MYDSDAAFKTKLRLRRKSVYTELQFNHFLFTFHEFSFSSKNQTKYNGVTIYIYIYICKTINFSLGHKPIWAQYSDHVDSIVNGNKEHLGGLISIINFDKGFLLNSISMH